MFVNNLYFLFNSVLSLIINIDEETLFNFLGIKGPFSTSTEIIHMATPVTSDTFKYILQEYWSYYRHGLGFVDIENIALFILIIRFIFLSKKYNIRTGFLITLCGLGAGYLWYMHFRDLAFYYMRSLWMCPLTHNLASDFSEIHFQQVTEFQRIGNRADSDKFYGAAVRGFVDLTNDNKYRYDPLSLLWNYLPTDIKFLSDKIYYFVTLKAIPKFYAFFNSEMSYLSGMLWYTFLVRINKRFCPYLIRWHWTFLIGLEFVERPFIYVQHRLIFYLNEILIPDSYFIEAELVTNLLVTLVAAQYIFISLGLLHALCGQYFYFPLLTENTELHIGLRPKDSIYSGGYTIWQNKRAYMISREASAKLRKYRFGTLRHAYSILPRMWYGWLGRGTLDDLTTEEYEKYLKNKANSDSLQRAKQRDSKIRWAYRRERLKKRFINLLAKLGIKVQNHTNDDDGDDLYEEFKNFSKK
jgi:hypothetical protein